MTTVEQANLILDALTQWAANNKGRAYIAADVVDVISEVMKPGAPTMAVLWTGEDVHGEYDQLGKVLRTWKVVISRGRGLKLTPGESLTEGVAGGPPMFDLVEQAREIVRDLRQEDQDPDFVMAVYKGTGPFEASGYILDAMEIRFGLYADIPRQEPGEPDAKETP